MGLLQFRDHLLPNSLAFVFGALTVCVSAVPCRAADASPAAKAEPAKNIVDWKVDCPNKGACVAHLDQPGVQILVGRLKSDTPVRMAFRISAMAKKGEPVTVRLDDGWQAALRVGNCSGSFCEVGVAKESTTLAVTALSRNTGGVIAYHAKDRILIIPISLKGFVEAMHVVGT